MTTVNKQIECPYSDGNSCMQYNAMGLLCQDCPKVWPELKEHRKEKTIYNTQQEKENVREN